MRDRPCFARSLSLPLSLSQAVSGPFLHRPLRRSPPSYARCARLLPSLPSRPSADDLHRRRDIIMETDVTYLNGTRGVVDRWMDGGERRDKGREEVEGARQRAMGEPHPRRDARAEGRKTPYTATQTRPTALPDGDPNLPHVWVTLGGLKGPTKCRPSCHRNTLLSRPNPRLPSPRSRALHPSVAPSASPRQPSPRCSLSRKSASICATFAPSGGAAPLIPRVGTY